jgi:cell division septum initiation protein DivIVA
VGGYDRETTEDLFQNLAASYERLWLESSELREQLSALDAELAQFEQEKRLLSETFIELRETGATATAEARREAEAMLRKARKRANAIVAAAEREAHARANRILSEVKTERSAVEEESMRLRVLAGETHQKLSSFLLTTLEQCSEPNGRIADREPTARHSHSGHEKFVHDPLERPSE